MKPKCLAVVGCLFGAILESHSQGYIVPNRVVYAGFQPLLGDQVNVLHDPTNSLYTAFGLRPQGPTTFSFDAIVDVSVRVFFVSPNDPISLPPILAQSYTELAFLNNYVFAVGVPFYVGRYTGNQNFHPPDGIYTDPLFGWARLVNNNGVIEMLDSALEYKGGGIYAGTQTIIPVPEPSSFSLIALGSLLFGSYGLRNCFCHKKRRKHLKLWPSSVGFSARFSNSRPKVTSCQMGLFMLASSPCLVATKWTFVMTPQTRSTPGLL